MTARHLRNIERMGRARDRDVWRWPYAARSADWAEAWDAVMKRNGSFDWTYTPGDTTETGTGGPGAGLSLENGGSEGSVGLSGDSGDVGGDCDNCGNVRCMGCVFREHPHECENDCPMCCVDGAPIPRTLVAEAVEQARADEREAIAGWLVGEESESYWEGICGRVDHSLAKAIRSGAHHEEADRG